MENSKICVTFHSDRARNGRALGSASLLEQLKLPKFNSVGQTNYQTVKQRIALICISPELHDSSTEDHGVWPRD